jgi:hypothetical protein
MAHLGSFVITTTPKPSLNHNLKSGTDVLTGYIGPPKIQLDETFNRGGLVHSHQR